jgi:hypothetical protein
MKKNKEKKNFSKTLTHTGDMFFYLSRLLSKEQYKEFEKQQEEKSKKLEEDLKIYQAEEKKRKKLEKKLRKEERILTERILAEKIDIDSFVKSVSDFGKAMGIDPEKPYSPSSKDSEEKEEA